MKTTIDSAGRIVIPSEIRKEAGLEPGVPLQVRYLEGRVEIEPEPLPIRLERRGRLLVAVPLRAVEPLTEETVAKTRDKLKTARGSRL